MKCTFLFCLSILFFTQAIAFENFEKERQLIEEQSDVFASAIKLQDVKRLASVFDQESQILPEYHHTLSGLNDINEYHRHFFDHTDLISYTKAPFEIERIGNLYVELGTFKHHYKKKGGEEVHYNGKYTTYWKIAQGTTPVVLAHIWGASHYFDADAINFINIETDHPKALIPETVWEKTIEGLRKKVYKAVLESNAKQQRTFYAEDAIYMTYYDPPFIGKKKISDYYHKHYQPNAVRDSLSTWSIKVIDLGDYALKFGMYHVGWTHEKRQYFIKGKGLTLYRKKQDGSIEIYRQMINHSMPPTLKKDPH